MRKFAAVVLMAILFTTVSCQKQPEVNDPMQTESTQAASTKTPASTETPVRDPYYFNSQIGMWYTVWWDSEQSDPTYFQHHWVKETRIEPVKFGYYATDDEAKILLFCIPNITRLKKFLLSAEFDVSGRDFRVYCFDFQQEFLKEVVKGRAEVYATPFEDFRKAMSL